MSGSNILRWVVGLGLSGGIAGAFVNSDNLWPNGKHRLPDSIGWHVKWRAG